MNFNCHTMETNLLHLIDNTRKTADPLQSSASKWLKLKKTELKNTSMWQKHFCTHAAHVTTMMHDEQQQKKHKFCFTLSHTCMWLTPSSWLQWHVQHVITSSHQMEHLSQISWICVKRQRLIACLDFLLLTCGLMVSCSQCNWHRRSWQFWLMPKSSVFSVWDPSHDAFPDLKRVAFLVLVKQTQTFHNTPSEKMQSKINSHRTLPSPVALQDYIRRNMLEDCKCLWIRSFVPHERGEDDPYQIRRSFIIYYFCWRKRTLSSSSTCSTVSKCVLVRCSALLAVVWSD